MQREFWGLLFTLCEQIILILWTYMYESMDHRRRRPYGRAQTNRTIMIPPTGLVYDTTSNRRATTDGINDGNQGRKCQFHGQMLDFLHNYNPS